MAMIVFFPLGHAAGGWVARVIESFRIRLPGHRAGARAIDHVRPILAARNFTNMKDRLLVAALRQAVSDQLAVPAWIPPVESDRAVFGEQVRIEKNAILALETFAHVRNRLVLFAFALGVEIEALPRHWYA